MLRSSTEASGTKNAAEAASPQGSTVGGRRNPDERGIHSYIAMTIPQDEKKSPDHQSGTDVSPTRSTGSASRQTPQPSPNRADSAGGTGGSDLGARRRLKLEGGSADDGEQAVGRFGGMKARLPQAVKVDGNIDDLEISTPLNGSVHTRQSEVSDFAESEAEASSRNYLNHTLNRTLHELVQLCEQDRDIDRCDEAMSSLLHAVRHLQTLRERLSSSLTPEADGSASMKNRPSPTSAGRGRNSITTSMSNGDIYSDLTKPFPTPPPILRDGSSSRLSSGLASPSAPGMMNSTPPRSPTKPPSPPKPFTWSDVVRCRSSQSGGSMDGRSLHEKLLSPDRHRKDPEEVQRKFEEKQQLAKRRKEELEALRQVKLREADMQRQERIRQIKEKRETEKSSIDDKLKKAEVLHQQMLLEKQQKAGKEASKVYGVKEEVAFIEELTAQSANSELQSRLELAEARRISALDNAAKSASEARAMREETARQRRAAIEEEKLEKIQARHAQKFGSIIGSGIKMSTAERDEAARLRRLELDMERQRKVEMAALEKKMRQEGHQKKLDEERLTALGAKELRIRLQTEQLDRITRAMEEDAKAQKHALETRLRAVLERKERYMQQVVSKAHASSEHGTAEHKDKDNTSLGKDDGGTPKDATGTTANAAAGIGGGGGGGGGVGIAEDAGRSKAMKKRARKYKARLASSRNVWMEDGGDEAPHHSSSSATAAKHSGKGQKLSRLLSEIVKGAPSVDDSERAAAEGRTKQQPCRDVDVMCQTLNEVHRQISAASTCEGDAQGGGGGGGGSREQDTHERDSTLVSIRKSGAIAALSRMITVDPRLMFPRLAGGALRVLLAACSLPTNRLYIVTTGRLLPFIVMLEETICSTIDSPHIFTIGRQLLELIALCLGTDVGGKAGCASRDDTVGYLVNTGLLSRLERLLIWAMQNVTATWGRICGGSSSDTDRETLFESVRLISASIKLLESITMCSESGGQVNTAVTDATVVQGLLAMLEECSLCGIVPLLSALFLECQIDKSWLQPPSEARGALFNTRDAIGDTIACAASALRVLTNVAVLDLGLLQRVLSTAGIQGEFSHVALQVLESVGCAVGRGPPTSTQMHGSGLSPADAFILFSYILDELILLIGYLAVGDGQGRSHFAGWRNGVKMLEQLCALPLSYYISPRLREVLLPTLLLATYKNRQLLSVMRRDVAPAMISKFVEHQVTVEEAQNLKGGSVEVPSSQAEGLSRPWSRLPPPSVPCRFHLANRFQRSEWDAAAAWFNKA